MLSYRKYGPLILGSCASLITLSFIIWMTLQITTLSPPHQIMPLTLTSSELEESRGWYAITRNGAPRQYHLTLRPIIDLLQQRCLRQLHEGDLLTVAITSTTCTTHQEPLKGSDLHALGIPLSLNSAALAELSEIRGIGERRAQQIIAGRPWSSLRSLTQLRGVGPKTIEKWRPYLTVSSRRLLWSAPSSWFDGSISPRLRKN